MAIALDAGVGVHGLRGVDPDEAQPLVEVGQVQGVAVDDADDIGDDAVSGWGTVLCGA